MTLFRDMLYVFSMVVVFYHLLCRNQAKLICRSAGCRPRTEEKAKKRRTTTQKNKTQTAIIFKIPSCRLFTWRY